MIRILLTDEEKKIDQELSRLVFEDSKGSKLFFELQVLDRLDEYKNLQNEDSISLMPGGIFYIVEKDMRMMGILLLICFANPCTAVSGTGTVMSCAAVVCDDRYRAENF